MKKTTGTMVLVLMGCSDSDSLGGQGSLRVLLEAESTITFGIAAGDGEEDIRDGWTVAFEHYVASLGAVSVRDSVDGNTRTAPEVFVVDLTQVSESGTPLWELDELDAGRWAFGYFVGHDRDAKRHSSAERALFDEFIEAGKAYRLVGKVEKPDGVSCPPVSLAVVDGMENVGENGGGVPCYANPEIGFDLSLGVDVELGPCERDGGEGFAIGEKSTTTVAVTIHGDHVFFNGFPEGAEGGVMRLAQWFADSDLNVDGTVTREELDALAPSELWELDLERYQFGGSPITPLDTLGTYLEAQLATQGHFQGEGECAIAFP
jgi:hypothetical protein